MKSLILQDYQSQQEQAAFIYHISITQITKDVCVVKGCRIVVPAMRYSSMQGNNVVSTDDVSKARRRQDV